MARRSSFHHWSWSASPRTLMIMDHIDRYSILEPDRVAVESEDRPYTYRQLSALISKATGALSGYRVRKGDLVAIWGGNDVATLIATWAVPRVGGVALPMNTRWSEAEARRVMDVAVPALVLGDGSQPDLGRQVLGLDGLQNGRPHDPEPHEPSDVHSVFATSGTGGAEKLVKLTWENHDSSALASSEVVPLRSYSSWLVVLPLFHIGGFAAAYRTFRAGGKVVLHAGFDAAAVAKALQSVTHASLVPTMLRDVLAAHEGPYSALTEAVLVGGAACPPGLVARARLAGLPVAPTYGMTETASQVATAAPTERRAGGLTVLPGVELEAGRGPDELDRIRVSGPMVSPGYLGEPSRKRGQWFETGDLGYVDSDQRLVVVSRFDDVIVTGGENVVPGDVEAALLTHPHVAHAAVYGVPDDRWGQRVEAAVVPAPDVPLDETALREAVAAQLAGFKVPKSWRFVDKLPLLTNGKVDREALRVASVEESL